MGRRPKEPKKLDDKFLFGGDKFSDKGIVSGEKEISDKQKVAGNGHVAKRSIIHNGKPYEIGESLDVLDEESVIALRESGAI